VCIVMFCLCHAGFKVICQRRGGHVYLQCSRKAMCSSGWMSMCLETSCFRVHSRLSFNMKMEDQVSLKHILKT
jgi:hypothetical protein